MKKFAKVFVILLAVFMGANASAASLPMPQSFADEVEKLSPAVVNISTTQKVAVKTGGEQYSFPPGSPFQEFNELLQKRNKDGKGFERDATSLGSGFIIDASGIVITNNHVVAEADEITVVLHDNTKLKAEIVGRDAKIDIAVLRVKSDTSLPFVSFGDSDKVRVGDWVIAIGNPYGLGGTVTTGIISARARDINVGSFDDFLQTDAAINRGNSGGPMFDLEGNVIGINTAIFSPTGGSVGIGFAIPSALAAPIVKQILEFGKAKRAWLGVQIQPVTESIAEALGMKKASGALVLSVMSDGPALKAGIIAGDVILKFDGREVSDVKKLPRFVAESPIGGRKTVQVLRDGKIRNLVVDLQELEEDNSKRAEKKVKPLNPQLKQGDLILGMALQDTPSRNGVEVVGISPNSDAFSKGVRDGALLLKANQKDIRKISDLLTAIDQTKAEGRKSLLLLVQSGTESRFIPINIGG